MKCGKRYRQTGESGVPPEGGEFVERDHGSCGPPSRLAVVSRALGSYVRREAGPFEESAEVCKFRRCNLERRRLGC